MDRNVDTDRLVCLNEAEEGSIKKVFKPLDSKLDRTEVTRNPSCFMIFG